MDYNTVIFNVTFDGERGLVLEITGNYFLMSYIISTNLFSFGRPLFPVVF
jgi:hypothetical protein